MLNFFKNSLQSLYMTITQRMTSLFSRTAVDEQTLQELEQLLLQADAGTATTRTIMGQVRKRCAQHATADGNVLRQILSEELLALLKPFAINSAQVYLLVGINGSGKTTCAAKLAHYFAQQQKKVLLVAADTFRAAATDQLECWAHELGVAIVSDHHQQDPGSVVFKGCKQFIEQSYDVLIIDTAGRLQTKTNLMHELTKIKRIITKQLTQHTVCTLLTIDAMLGQNSLEQARLFHEATTVDGIILTKMDGTGKGGMVFAINHLLSIPVAFIALGEKKEQIAQFDPQQYVHGLLNEQ